MADSRLTVIFGLPRTDKVCRDRIHLVRHYSNWNDFVRAIYLSEGLVEFRPNYIPGVQRSDLIAVQVLKAGICETDLQLKQGYMDFAGVLGHEFVGIATSGRFSGQRVVGEINCFCGSCDFCDRSLPRMALSTGILRFCDRELPRPRSVEERDPSRS